MKKKVAVLGAGISGLARAFALQDQYGDQIDLIVLEASQRPGGWIRSVVKEGFFFEEGPRSCRTRGAGIETLKLIEKLGLADQVMLPSEAARDRYLYANKQLHKLPRSLLEFFKSPLMKGMLPAFWRERKVPYDSGKDFSIQEFVTNRLGSGIAERLFDPMVSGIYAGDISKLSMRSAFPTIEGMVREHGSLFRAVISKLFKKTTCDASSFVKSLQKVPFFTLKGGMEVLVKSLVDKLNPLIKYGMAVKAIDKAGEQIVIATECGQSLFYDEVHLALPSHVVSSLIGVSQLECASVVSVSMGWNAHVLPFSGFGYLIPSSERESLLGVVWDSSAFPEQNNLKTETRMTAMLGGVRHPEYVEASDELILRLVLAGIDKHMGIKQPPKVVHISRGRQAIPQYNCGHEAHVQQVEHKLKDKFQDQVKLLGSAWYGVSVNDCISHALKLSH